MRYAGVLAAAIKVRPKIVPHAAKPGNDVESDDKPKRKGSRYWPCSHLMARTFAIDVEKCPKCDTSVSHLTISKDACRCPKVVGENFVRQGGSTCSPPHVSDASIPDPFAHPDASTTDATTTDATTTDATGDSAAATGG